MKLSLLLISGAAGAVVFSSCTTLENRRDLYAPQKVRGPYTRMLQDGIPKVKTVVVTEDKKTTYSAQ